ncbi:MAG: hypothetical protein XE13_0010 [Proteiniphilum sp. 51_7]|nr:MAG: hypothetical protein XE13_0010 [Proteiniphilum sp. 51_7]
MKRAFKPFTPMLMTKSEFHEEIIFCADYIRQQACTGCIQGLIHSSG